MMSSVAAERPATALSRAALVDGSSFDSQRSQSCRDVSHTRTCRSVLCTSFDLSRKIPESSRTCAGPNAALRGPERRFEHAPLSTVRHALCDQDAPAESAAEESAHEQAFLERVRVREDVLESARRSVVSTVRCCAPRDCQCACSALGGRVIRTPKRARCTKT
jgi:hypothetical protein